MNIHVDGDLIIDLFASELVRVPFGSHVYGLDTESSDEDYICIYAESNEEKQSFLWEHHNFQVCMNKTDYIFTNLKNFIRNLINGDMPGNLESIHIDDFINSEFKFLYDRRHYFYSYTNIRSFLGYAKRDLKHALRDDSRLCHAYRCIESAKMMLNGEYHPVCKNWDNDVYQLLRSMKFGQFTHDEKIILCNNLNDESSYLRDSINKKLESGQLVRYMTVENMQEIDEWLLHITQTPWYTKHVTALESVNHFKYDVLENGIKY